MSLPALLLSAVIMIFGPSQNAGAQAGCGAPKPVCDARDAVFRIASPFDPYASAVRVGKDLLVTNRHTVADEQAVTVTLAEGAKRDGKVVPSSYGGDLVLIRVALPDGPIAAPAPEPASGPFYGIGQAVSARAIRVFKPGVTLALPADGKPFARLFHTARTPYGSSGGALVDGKGRLVAIIASGGEGRNEAIPAGEIARLRQMSGPQHTARSATIGRADRDCTEANERVRRWRGRPDPRVVASLIKVCEASKNRQLVDLAGQVAGRSGANAEAQRLFKWSLERDPNAINTRLSLIIVLHFARAYKEELEHIRRLLKVIPEEPMLHRFAIQAGKWGGDTELVARGLELIKKHNPGQLEAAERFVKMQRPPQQRPRPAKSK